MYGKDHWRRLSIGGARGAFADVVASDAREPSAAIADVDQQKMRLPSGLCNHSLFQDRRTVTTPPRIIVKALRAFSDPGKAGVSRYKRRKRYAKYVMTCNRRHFASMGRPCGYMR